MTLNTLVGRVCALLAQLILAKLLLPEEFGVWAVALSLATMAKTLQDLGVRELLIQRDGGEDPHVVGSVAYLGLALNLASGAILVAIGYSLADVYGYPELPGLCLIVAAQIVVLTGWTVNGALLRRQLRFRMVAVIEIVGALSMFAGQIIGAVAGLGVYAFAAPLLISAFVRAGFGAFVTRRRIFRTPPDLAFLRKEYSAVGWLLLGALALALYQQADYLALGFLMPASELGFYFFAYQIAAQVGVLLSNNLQIVMFPIFSRMLRAGRTVRPYGEKMSRVLLASACITSSLAIFGFAPLQQSLYGDKWSGAEVAVFALAAAFPLRTLFVLPRSTLLAMGRFRFVAVLTSVLGVGLLVSSIVVGLVDPTASVVASVNAVYLAASGLFALGVFARVTQIRVWRAVADILVPYLAWLVPTSGAYAFARSTGSGWAISTAALLLSAAVALLLWRVLSPALWRDLVALSSRGLKRLRRRDRRPDQEAEL